MAEPTFVRRTKPMPAPKAASKGTSPVALQGAGSGMPLFLRTTQGRLPVVWEGKRELWPVGDLAMQRASRGKSVERMRAQRWLSPADVQGAIAQGAIDLRGAQWPTGLEPGSATTDPWSDTYKDDEFVVSTDPSGVTILQPATETRIRAAEVDPQQLTEQAKLGAASTVQIAYELAPPQDGKPGEVVLVVGPGAAVEIQRPPPQDVREKYGQMQVIEELRRFVPVPESALEGRSITSDFGGFDLTIIEMPDNSLVPPQFQPLDVPTLLQVPGATVRGPDKEIWTGTLSRQQEFIEKWTLIGSLAFAAVGFGFALAEAVMAASLAAEVAAPLAATEAATAPVVGLETEAAAPLVGLETEGAAPLMPMELAGPEVESAGLEVPFEQPPVEDVPGAVEAPQAPPRPAPWPLRKVQELVFRGALHGTRAAEVLPEFEDVAGLVETQSGEAAMAQAPEVVGSQALTPQATLSGEAATETADVGVANVAQAPQPAAAAQATQSVAPATVHPVAAGAVQTVAGVAATEASRLTTPRKGMRRYVSPSAVTRAPQPAPQQPRALSREEAARVRQRIELLAQQRIIVGMQAKITVGGEPALVGLRSAQFSQFDARRAAALGETGRAAILSEVTQPPGTPARRGSQPSSGLIVEPGHESRELEAVAWNTGEPVKGHNTSHAERQFIEWLRSQDPAWLDRVTSVDLTVFGRDVCELCNADLNSLRKAYPHIKFNWVRGDL